MKKLLIFTALFSTLLFSCKTKKDDPAPVAVTPNPPNNNNLNGQIGLLTFYSATHYNRFHNSTKSTPNYSTYRYSNPSASFYTTLGSPSAVGSLSFAGESMIYMNSNYMGVTSGNHSFPLYWKIGSGNGFPGAEVKMTAQPDSFALADADFMDSISTSVPYTIKLNKKLTNADKISIVLWEKIGSDNAYYTTEVYTKEEEKGLDTFTFSPAELSKMASSTWKSGQIQVVCSNDTSVSIGTTIYKFSTERSIKLDVYFK